MKKALVVLTLLTAFCAGVFAGESANQDILLTFDGFARIRYEFLNNNTTLGSSNDERDYFRFKFSGGLRADLFNMFSVYGKFTTESRSYIYNAGGDAKYDINETAVDNLYISIPKLFEKIDVKIGRMDLLPSEYGEGFLIGDGTPLDGSRTYYFNAAKIKYNIPDADASIEILSVYNSEFDDLPVINDKDAKINDSQESAFIAYGKAQATSKLYVEPYYMFKTEHETDTPENSYAHQKIALNTFGSYLKYDLNPVTLRAQAALQLGSYGNETGKAFGGYIYADVPLLDIFKPLSLGYVYLSGDDYDTKTVEAWNPLFSRYPWISEILVMLYRTESGAGYLTNLQMGRLTATFKPFEKMTINASYNLLYANESVRGSGTASVFGDGINRGTLIICKTSYKFSEIFSAYILGEYFVPGDFYYKDAKDAAFIRAEFSAKI